MTGFKIEPGQNKIAIPIKSQNLDGSYRTIANGNISFKQNYSNGAFIAFMIHMGSNKVITMKAWTSKDAGGSKKIEEGYVEISIDNSERSKIKAKFIAPSGAKLQPKAEINNMLQLCQNQERCRQGQEKSNLSKRIANAVSNICNAGNKEDFAEAVLEAFSNTSSEEPRLRLFIIARKLAHTWTESEKKKLATICMTQLSADLHGFSIGGAKVTTNIQAILALSVCGSLEQLSAIATLHEYPRYLQACLYTHAKTRTDLPWLLEEFEKDVNQVLKNFGSNLQFSSYAIGVALRKDGIRILSAEAEEKVVKNLCKVIRTGNLKVEELICCILALGCICDQRQQETQMRWIVINEALEVIREIDSYYTVLTTMKCEKAREVVKKMINGDCLNEEEEQFLLTKLEKDIK